MSEPHSIEAKQPGKRAAFWITLARSMLALALGLALILDPDKTRPILGAFEIVLGLVVLVWRDDFGSIFYAVASIWAFLGSLLLLREALKKRAEAH